MGVAYSNTPIIRTTFDGSTPVNFLAGFRAVAEASGWGIASITDGYEFTLQSPQGGLAPVKLRVWASFYPWMPNRVICRMVSSDGLRAGRDRWINASATWTDPGTFEIHANGCQFFVARAGLSDDTVSGGIPRVADLSDAQLFDAREMTWDDQPVIEDVTEAWWCAGPGGWNATLRWSPYDPDKFDACWNGVLISPDYTLGSLSSLLLPPVVPVTGRYRFPATWWNDEPLYLDPLLAWPPQPGQPSRIFAQLWDAVQCSVRRPLGDEIEFDGLDWVNWMYASDVARWPDCFYASLYLLKGAPPGRSRGSYAY